MVLYYSAPVGSARAEFGLEKTSEGHALKGKGKVQWGDGIDSKVMLGSGIVKQSKMFRRIALA